MKLNPLLVVAALALTSLATPDGPLNRAWLPVPSAKP